MMERLRQRGWAWWLADGITVAVVLLWFIGTRNLPDFVLPGPVPVVKRLLALFTDWDFLSHTLASTVRVLASVFIALVLGSVLAFIQRGVPALDWVFRGFIQPVLNSFPSIGWAILAALWFDPGHLSIIFVQVAILTPFCLINVGEGLRQLDVEALEMANSFSRNRSRVLRTMTFPLLLPYLLGALRISYGIAWKISLVAELLGATSGLGYLMLQAQGSADMTTVIATCFAIVILFVVGERVILDPLSRKFAYRGSV
jgi:NitT/TauT family transport system permease protein/sulfonate transport system permease protein